MTFTDDQIEIAWKAVKHGARLKHVMEMFKCDRDAALQVYDLAEQKFGIGPRIKDAQRSFEKVSTTPVKEWERPPAVYSNKDFSNY